MTTTIGTSNSLSLINITDSDTTEYLIMSGEDVWGWVGKVVVDGQFLGFQVVRWDATPRTTRMRAWHQVANLNGARPVAELTRGWATCTDLYADDVLSAEAAQVRQQRVVEQSEQAARERADAEAAHDHAVLIAAVRAHADIDYHGLLTALHGRGRILGWCDCAHCDSDTDLIEITVNGRVIEHVRFASVTLVEPTRTSA